MVIRKTITFILFFQLLVFPLLGNTKGQAPLCLSPKSTFQVSSEEVKRDLTEWRERFIHKNEVFQNFIKRSKGWSERREKLRSHIEKVMEKGKINRLYRPSFVHRLYQDMADTFPYLDASDNLLRLPKWKQWFLAWTLNGPALIKFFLATPFTFHGIYVFFSGVISGLLKLGLSHFSVPLWMSAVGGFALVWLLLTGIQYKVFLNHRGQADAFFVYINKKRTKKHQEPTHSPAFPLKVLIHEFLHHAPGYKNYFVQEMFSAIYVQILLGEVTPEDFSDFNFGPGKEGEKLALKDIQAFEENNLSYSHLIQSGKVHENLEALSSPFGTRPKSFTSNLLSAEIYDMPYAIGTYIATLHKHLKNSLDDDLLVEDFIRSLSHTYLVAIVNFSTFQPGSFSTQESLNRAA